MDEDLPMTVLFSAGDRGNKDRKEYLARRMLINCGRCRYHRGENETRRNRDPHDKRIAWKTRARVI